MSRQSFPIVGAKFRPPAQALLNQMPLDTPLIVRREKTNQYDANALQVLVRGEAFAGVKGVTEACQGYGFSREDILSRKEWHLGYIPRESAQVVSKRLDERSIEEIPAILIFSMEGSTKVCFDLI